jgi:hypothetical protein
MTRKERKAKVERKKGEGGEEEERKGEHSATWEGDAAVCWSTRAFEPAEFV